MLAIASTPEYGAEKSSGKGHATETLTPSSPVGTGALYRGDASPNITRTAQKRLLGTYKYCGSVGGRLTTLSTAENTTLQFVTLL
ncbi:hypothetical protein MRX96_023991 [Rhipicephalus microplus]